MDHALIIEDDKDIANLVALHLEDINLKADCVYDGREGLLKALNGTYSIIILDIRLPQMDGFEVCKRLRYEKVTTPVLILTSKAEEIDKVLGLEIGADDYLTKPFSIRELIARVKAILRRWETVQNQQPDETDRVIDVADLHIHVGKRIVEINHHPVELTPKEFDLLVFLASNPGKTYSRMQLLNKIWGYEFEGFEHTVNSHINRLRSKIEKNLNEPEYILTTWGVGYKFRD
jgi:DNA-binding response OmpR family regulator